MCVKHIFLYKYDSSNPFRRCSGPHSRQNWTCVNASGCWNHIYTFTPPPPPPKKVFDLKMSKWAIPERLTSWCQDNQAPKLKLKPGLITSTWLHLIIRKIFIILHHPYCCYVYTLHNLFAHSSCTSLLILLFIKSTVYCPAHFILSYCTFYSYLFWFYFFIFYPLFMYILLCCVRYNCTVHRADLTYISLLIIFCIIEWRIKPWILEYPFCDYVAKFKWKRFNKLDRYLISKNTWNDQVTRQKYYYKFG